MIYFRVQPFFAAYAFTVIMSTPLTVSSAQFSRVANVSSKGRPVPLILVVSLIALALVPRLVDVLPPVWAPGDTSVEKETPLGQGPDAEIQEDSSMEKVEEEEEPLLGQGPDVEIPQVSVEIPANEEEDLVLDQGLDGGNPMAASPSQATSSPVKNGQPQEGEDEAAMLKSHSPTPKTGYCGVVADHLPKNDFLMVFVYFLLISSWASHVEKSGGIGTAFVLFLV